MKHLFVIMILALLFVGCGETKEVTVPVTPAATETTTTEAPATSDVTVEATAETPAAVSTKKAEETVIEKSNGVKFREKKGVPEKKHTLGF